MAACTSNKKDDGEKSNPVIAFSAPGNNDVIVDGPSGPQVAFNSKYVRLLGRTSLDAPGGLLLTWPGSAVRVRVASSKSVTFTVATRQHGEFSHVGLFIDDGAVTDYNLSGSYGPQPIKVSVPIGEHTITLVKRTEAGNGAILLSSITTDSQFEAVPDPKRVIEVVGENFAAGYSVDGPAGVTADPGCQQSSYDAVNAIANPNFQNAMNTFGVLTAKSFNADWSLVAYTGRGLVQNYDSSRGNTMPVLWNYADPTDARTKIPDNYQPDVVVINLGANDLNFWFRTPTVPADAAGFQAAMAKFIATIHGKFPAAKIIATVGPNLGDYQKLPNGQGLLTTARTAIQAAVAQAGVAEASFLEFAVNSTNVSCDYYPDKQGHKIVADKLTAYIAQVTGWQPGSHAATTPAVATVGNGPKNITGTFDPLADPIASAGDPSLTGISMQEFPQCHICSPRPYATVPGCAAVVGEPQPCQGYCHVPDTFMEAYATNPPASGNHFAVPEAYLGDHPTAVGRGHYLHSMEHGAVVITYNCPGGCDNDLTTLRNLVNSKLQGANKVSTDDPANTWVILTADPLLTGSKFAALAWSWVYAFDTVDTAAVNCFIAQHKYFGRECDAVGTTERTTPAAGGCSPLRDKPMSSVQ